MNVLSKYPKSAELTMFLLILTGMIMNGFSLSLSHYGDISWGGNPTLFCLNALPIVLILMFLWLATGLAWLSAAITGTLLFLLTGANYFKLLFRSTPMFWSDLANAREGFGMASQYDVAFTPLMWLWIFIMAAMVALLVFYGQGKPRALPRLLAITAVGMFLLICFYDLYPNNDRYTDLAGRHAANETDAYAACGVVYPFMHSAGDDSDANYDERAARELYNQYQDAPIPPDRKVNIIGIQLEAFADLNQMGIQGISDDVYKDFYALQAKSYHGTLVTDIFAGGTAESEWAVLTGGNQHDDFKYKTDSVAWYMKDQGYTSNGSHPCRDWFYDRKHVNPNIGLDDYLFTDNYYNQYTDGDVVYDDVYFPDFEQRLTEYFSGEHAPLFSFNVTYQGHGPYNMEKTYWGSGYFSGPYSEATCNAMNNYLHLVQDTSHYLVEFTQYLNTLQEPVVLFFYGDHKPWMGNLGALYEEMGVNLDTTTEEGFLNYYTTQYTIWANDAAKNLLGQSFVGEGPTLSPCFLMDHLFGMLGWQGPAYMQAQRPVANALPVLHTTGWVMENGVLTPKPSPASRALMDQFQNLSRYDRTRWK